MRRPCVYLVGAGPGDPGLITARGLRCLAAADVVIHDHAVHPRLLRSTRPDSEHIDVGAAAPEPLQQDAISLLVLQKAAEGKVVVRLKWGDPFLFDSGGKEALFLHEHGVPFEVVPGIPAAVAMAAYAGVPITYPGAGDTVTLVRGHESGSDKPLALDWNHLAPRSGTLVCYAGPQQLPRLIHGLLTHGHSNEEPAALVYDGTLPTQQTIQGTLGELNAQARDGADSRPALVIVGRTTALLEHVRWFDVRPLFGRRIVVTRSREQAGELVELLEELGARTVEAPTIRIEPPDDVRSLDEACAQAGTFDWIVFTSANGVDFFMGRLLAGPGDVRDLKGVRLCTIGPATADRLRRFGIRVDLMPAEYRAEAVLDALQAHGDLENQRILLPRANIARDLLAEELRRAGAEVREIAAYRTELVEGDPGSDLYRMLLEGQIDVVTFTSASTVRNFARQFGADTAADLLRTTIVASIGPVTAEAARHLNIETTIMPSSYTIPALVEAIVDHFKKENR
jgi:uroporphyrinogen III methyltransferase / synthase